MGLIRFGWGRAGLRPNTRGSARLGLNPGPQKKLRSVKPGKDCIQAYPGLSPSFWASKCTRRRMRRVRRRGDGDGGGALPPGDRTLRWPPSHRNLQILGGSRYRIWSRTK
uniref:Uncharacterized protein n=1 Tax=Oryza meridionalis TaxID=40149 RepID=A0A0E0E2X8_9ORYZ